MPRKSGSDRRGVGGAGDADQVGENRTEREERTLSFDRVARSHDDADSEIFCPVAKTREQARRPCLGTRM